MASPHPDGVPRQGLALRRFKPPTSTIVKACTGQARQQADARRCFEFPPILSSEVSRQGPPLEIARLNLAIGECRREGGRQSSVPGVEYRTTAHQPLARSAKEAGELVVRDWPAGIGNVRPAVEVHSIGRHAPTAPDRGCPAHPASGGEVHRSVTVRIKLSGIPQLLNLLPRSVRAAFDQEHVVALSCKLKR
jgi:hypothetical protein